MLKKISTGLAAGLAVVAAIGYGVYAGNAAPVLAPITASEAADPARPFVIKLHAQWCPVCMLTKGVWSDVEERYAGRVNLLVIDVTTAAAAAASEREAARLGLERFFAEHSGITGAVAVVDGASNDVTAFLPGKLPLSDYTNAIDASLAGAAPAPRGN